MSERKVLLIYTGGTIGMKKDYEDYTLKPFDFTHVSDEVPELLRTHCELDVHAFANPIDSSDMSPEIWIELVSLIEKNYHKYDGFVILHGSDTMAYTASALSFMLENLSKPVVLTGSQLPIGTLRTDGKENLITAIEIASAHRNGVPRVPEVCIYFEYSLYRGNRSRKVDAEHFKAFETLNYPLLAEAGVSIKYNDSAILSRPDEIKPSFSKKLNPNMAILKFFPGISSDIINGLVGIPNLKGVVLESFGNGNIPARTDITNALKKLLDKDVTVINTTQCHGGSVIHGRYENSQLLNDIGVISGRDMTTEAAITKLMYLHGKYNSTEDIINYLDQQISGEISEVN